MRWFIFVTLVLTVCCEAAAFVLQNQQERQLLEQSIALQEQVTQSGLREAWLTELGNAVDQRRIAPGYALTFDRQGRELVRNFFPSQTPKMDWAH